MRVHVMYVHNRYRTPPILPNCRVRTIDPDTLMPSMQYEIATTVPVNAMADVETNNSPVKRLIRCTRVACLADRKRNVSVFNHMLNLSSHCRLLARV
jgi:hypothetical protein